MNLHPLAEMYPLLPAEQMDDLVESIKEDGLLEPIVTIDHKGKTVILDGQNRAVACERAGVEPTFVRFEEIAPNIDPERYVHYLNIMRRHLGDETLKYLAAKSKARYLKKAGRPKKGAEKSPSTEGNFEWSDRAGADFHVAGPEVEKADRLLRAVAGEPVVALGGKPLEPAVREKLEEEIDKAWFNGIAPTVGALEKKYLQPKEPKELKPEPTRLSDLLLVAEIMEALPHGPLSKEERDAWKRVEFAGSMLEEVEAA